MALIALGLALLPLLSAGAEKEIVAVSSTDMVDRSIPDSVTYVKLSGLATAVVLPGPGSADAPPYGVLVRDRADSNAFTIVSTPRSPNTLQSRYVIGRITNQSRYVLAPAVFEVRGEDVAGLDPTLVLVEVVPDPSESIRDVSGVGDLPSLPPDTLVRIPLAFSGEAAPPCYLERGPAALTEDCGDRTLAAGHGIFVNLARGIPDAAPVLVQTAYPASVAPGTWTGTQLRNGTELEAWASTVPVRLLAGWGRVLVLASIIDDPTVGRDRLWLGPIVLGVLAAALWLGLRIGYPVFRPAVEGSRRWAVSGQAEGAATWPSEPMTVRVSGHGSMVDGRRVHLDEDPARLAPASTAGLAAGRVTASLHLAGGELALATGDIGALGSIEPGEVVSLRRVRPALWVRWFGTNLRITFDTAADRDLAVRLIGG